MNETDHERTEALPAALAYWRTLPAESFDDEVRTEISRFVAGISSTIPEWRAAARGDAGAAVSLVINIDRPAVLEYDGPADLDELGSDKRFVFRATVRIGRARTIRTRARFDRLAVEFDVMFLPTLLNRAEVVDTFMTAGFTKGIGDWRPTFGTYLAEERNK